LKPTGSRQHLLAAAVRFAWLLLVITWSGAAQALTPGKAFHNFIRDSWSTEQGLPNIAVLAIAQDAEGYIWVGTPNGLARFDGVRFTHYLAATTPGLPGDVVKALQLDADGRLWIGTRKGLAWYRGGAFTAIPNAPETPAESADILNILTPADGSVLLATRGGLSRVVDGQLSRDRSITTPVHTLLEADGSYWLGGAGGVHQIQGGPWTSRYGIWSRPTARSGQAPVPVFTGARRRDGSDSPSRTRCPARRSA